MEGFLFSLSMNHFFIHHLNSSQQVNLPDVELVTMAHLLNNQQKACGYR